MTGTRTHEAHVFTRLISKGANGQNVYGCSAYASCGETETRRPQEPSPFALAQQKRRDRAAARRFR